MAFPKSWTWAADALASGPAPPGSFNIAFGEPFGSILSRCDVLPAEDGPRWHGGDARPQQVCRAMKPKIGVYLTSHVAKRLRLAARRSGATKSDIVNEALARYLDPPPESDPNEAVHQRLDRLARAVRRLHRDVEIMTETLALHIRQFLTITPPVPKSEQQEAEKLGRERYEVFVRQIARRVASDDCMVSEVMARIAETHGGRCTRPMGNGAMSPSTSQPPVTSRG